MEHMETPIYYCPMCGEDAPHTIQGQINETYAIRCTNCSNGSLVCDTDLRLHQARWEEELREIIKNLDGSRD